MPGRNWFIIANEDMAIIASEDKSLVLMPCPTFKIIGEGRAAVSTGSKSGAKTFTPGTNLEQALQLVSEGPVQYHTSVPEELRSKCGDILDKHCLAAQEELKKLLEDNLTPKQKPTNPVPPEFNDNTHTEGETTDAEA